MNKFINILAYCAAWLIALVLYVGFCATLLWIGFGMEISFRSCYALTLLVYVVVRHFTSGKLPPISF